MSTSKAGTSISVIITCYNYARYVGFAIDSALEQTRPPNEVIVVDDGSTDDSREIISTYGDKIRTLFKQNEGVITTVNQAYELSSGDIVIFLDADDVLEKNALFEIEKKCRQSASKIQFDLHIIDGAGKLLGRRFCNFKNDQSPQETLNSFKATGTYAWPVTSGNAYMRSFLAQVMPMTPPVSHDGVLNTIAPLYGDVITISKPLGRYRLHGTNYSLVEGKSGHPNFARAIRNRLGEFQFLALHAQKKGVALPNTNFLDHELAFVGYRLMSLRLGLDYEGSESDSVLRLWWLAIQSTLSLSTSYKDKLQRLAWLFIILVPSRRVATLCVDFRYNRALIRERLGRALRKLF